VPGCSGTTIDATDYCFMPTVHTGNLALTFIGDELATGSYSECEGDCDNDADCLGDDLFCFQRSSVAGTSNSQVPNCDGTGIPSEDYCYSLPPLTNTGNGGSNYEECHGDCDGDDDCIGSLVCFQSDAGGGKVPGCSGTTIDATDYCFMPTVHTGNLALTFIGDELATGSYSECEGDCDNDADCLGDDLFCFQRSSVAGTSNSQVPNCDGTGIPSEDYCYRLGAAPPSLSPTICSTTPVVSTAQPTGPITYKPGENTASDADGYLSLSTGLSAKIIARSGQKVPLSDCTESDEIFHTLPDGAAVFPSADGGWTYVSNSEAGSSSTYTGGVGAISFNELGQITGYNMIQTNTRRNCSGGKTWWGTWVTAEECGGTGGVFEVHPNGHTNGDASTKRKTLLGERNGRSGGNYEGVAYYNPSPNDPGTKPSFFLTEDAQDGPLERFQPSDQTLSEAIASDDYSNLLHEDPDMTATTDYLNIISWDSEDGGLTHTGTFDWTDSYSTGAAKADNYFQQCEGIDVRNGMLYMTCKRNKQFFILDLEEMTYAESHTDGGVGASGPFTGQPDQIRALVGDDSLVYFCEDVGDSAGIHAKDSTGKYYTIAQEEGSYLAGETSGLAFSPDNIHMYVAYQKNGFIYDITRDDGRPFGGETLAIQYHGMNDGGSLFSRFLRGGNKKN